jgi:hypothetical protein
MITAWLIPERTNKSSHHTNGVPALSEHTNIILQYLHKIVCTQKDIENLTGVL